MSINSKMTAIADKIRTLLGLSGKMGLDSMALNLGTAINESDTQADLIAQIKIALNGKAIEGGGSGGVQLPSLSNPGSADSLEYGKQMIDANGNVVTGTVTPIFDAWYSSSEIYESNGNVVSYTSEFSEKAMITPNNSEINIMTPLSEFGNATAADVVKGKTFTSSQGLKIEGTMEAQTTGGVVYPDGAFAPVTSFTAGKQYALVSLIGGVRRYINTTTYNNYTMNATQITIKEDAGDYVIFNATPVLFTAVASGNGFLLQNGTNYLHGTTSNGTALRVGTTQAVWTVDTSATGGFPSGKYNTKEDPNAVWLFTNTGGYDWSIKYETAGSFGFDRNGRDNTYSTGFTPFVLYEYVAGEGTTGTTSGGSVIKTGTTTSATINTGLSEVEEFFIYKESQTATGLIHLHYSKTGGTSYLYASAWSTNNYGTKTITNSTTNATVNGGSITLPSNTATSGGLSSGATYKWIAIGTE